MTESEKALAIHHLSRMVKTGRYLDCGAHISLPVLHSLGIALNALKERRTGKWIKDIYGNVVCSECRANRRDNRIGHIAFCNSCGAKMEVEE